MKSEDKKESPEEDPLKRSVLPNGITPEIRRAGVVQVITELMQHPNLPNDFREKIDASSIIQNFLKK
jgi:hypothetical protein